MELVGHVVNVLIGRQSSSTDAGLYAQGLSNDVVGTGRQDRCCGAGAFLDIGVAAEEVTIALELHSVLAGAREDDLAIFRLGFQIGAEVDDSAVHQFGFAQETALTSGFIIVLDALHLREMEEVLGLNHHAQRTTGNFNDRAAVTDRTDTENLALQEAAGAALVVSHTAAHLCEVTGAAVFRHIDFQHIVAIVNEGTNLQIVVIEAARSTGSFRDIVLVLYVVSRGGNGLDRVFFLSRLGGRSNALSVFHSLLRRGNRGGHLVGLDGGGVQHFVLVHGIGLLCRDVVYYRHSLPDSRIRALTTTRRAEAVDVRSSRLIAESGKRKIPAYHKTGIRVNTYFFLDLSAKAFFLEGTLSFPIRSLFLIRGFIRSSERLCAISVLTSF